VRNVAAALSALVPLIAGAFVTQAQDSACTSERWLPPREVRTREGYTVFMERPSIAPLRGEVFLPAWPTSTYDSLGTIVWPLAPGGRPSSVEHVPLGALIDRHGVAELVAWPKDILSGPWLPVGVADDSGIGHVIWGSRDNVQMSSSFMVRSLWYGRFDGRQWSAPTRVLSTEGTVMWNSAMVSPLIAHGRSLHLVVAIQGEGLRYVRLDSGAWTERRVNIPSVYMGYPHITVMSSGRLLLLIQGDVAHPPAPAISGVYITRSDDRGESWSPPTPISRVDEAPAFDARLVVDDRDVLYAFWYQQTDQQGHPATGVTLGGSPGRIYATRSFDSGVTWQRTTSTPLIDNANELQVLLRRDHSVLAVVADGIGERMLISSWSSGWSPFTIIDATPHPFNPSLGTDDAQRPFLTWGIRRTHDWLGTMMMTLVPCG
jgi:hypothetical protein